jgi:hypothetical protein
MEGTYTTLNDLFMFEAGGSVPDRIAENREVFNYVRALEGAIDDLSKLPISARLLKKAHKALLSGQGKCQQCDRRRDDPSDSHGVPPPTPANRACGGRRETQPAPCFLPRHP